MEYCPICNGPLNDAGECAICGYKKSEATEIKKRRRKKALNKGLSVWSIVVLVMLNICVCLTIINLAMGGLFWAHYVTLCCFTVGTFVYSIFTKKIKKIALRLRLSVLSLYIIACIYIAILHVLSNDYAWIWQYYIPSIITFSNIVTLIILLYSKLTLSNGLISYMLNLVLASMPLILMIVIPSSDAVIGTTVCAFGTSLLGVVNLLYVKLIHWKRQFTQQFTKK